MRLILSIVGLSLVFVASAASAAPIVTFDTSLGSFQVQLYDDTPITTANFMSYVDSGRYVDTFIHRSVSSFVIQGGGYTYSDVDGYPQPIPLDPNIANEFNHSNVRGTIAMAKQDGDPNSANSQWFFNLVDNSANLDFANGGYTVFGVVLGSGMDVVDAIAALPTTDAGAPFDELPYHDYTGGFLTSANLVMVTVTPEPATLALLAVGGLAMLRRRRARR